MNAILKIWHVLWQYRKSPQIEKSTNGVLLLPTLVPFMSESVFTLLVAFNTIYTGHIECQMWWSLFLIACIFMPRHVSHAALTMVLTEKYWNSFKPNVINCDSSGLIWWKKFRENNFGSYLVCFVWIDEQGTSQRYFEHITTATFSLVVWDLARP